ncbi:MAG: SocA family protein [Clostridiales Family XIII bacterium]|nr:SocA family protein [Clostridiales Family XIII bacterium]
MKLQKLLFFANLLYLSEYGKTLFKEPIRAFSQGSVIEEVRLMHKNNFDALIREAEHAAPDYEDDELRVLDAVSEIFGNASAKELSELNHTFDFWKKAHVASEMSGGYKNKEKGIIPVSDMLKESARMKEVMIAFESSKTFASAKDTINGVDFFYDETGMSLTDEVLDTLYRFSLTAEDNAYSVYRDNGNLVIY